MNTYGGITPAPRFLYMEAHKLHLHFIIAAGVSIYAGQMVKLTATGEVTPFLAADAERLNIGVAIMTRVDGGQDIPYLKSGDQVTVAVKGYNLINAEAGAAVVCGPVKYSGLSAGKVPQYVNLAGSGDEINHCGWAIVAGAAQGNVIQVIMKA